MASYTRRVLHLFRVDVAVVTLEVVSRRRATGRAWVVCTKQRLDMRCRPPSVAPLASSVRVESLLAAGFRLSCSHASSQSFFVASAHLIAHLDSRVGSTSAYCYGQS